MQNTIISDEKRFTTVSVDEIVRQCQVTAPVVHTVLLEMELAGLIERQPGNRIAAI